VFERFTQRARQVVVFAQDEARALKHNYMGTEHLLLGLLREEQGLAARVLASFEITLDRVRAEIVRIVGRGDEVTGGPMPLTPRTKKVLELSLREAISLGHKYIGTEHILLGLARENEGVAMRILLDSGADAEKVRNEVIRVLSGGAGPPPPVEAGAAADPMPAEAWVSLDPPESQKWLVDNGSRRKSIVLCSVLAGAAMPVGIFIGWLIWG
jgi:ATP-dependent Clp protease ATP-binding subunit ClpC